MKTTRFTSWHFALVLAAVVLFLTGLNGPSAPQTQAPAPSWQVYFSPRGRATSAIVQTIDKARSIVLVQAYSFTSIPIAEALVRAHQRGVRVQVLLDKAHRSQERFPSNNDSPSRSLRYVPPFNQSESFGFNCVTSRRLLLRFGVIATCSEQRPLSQFLHPHQIAQPQSFRRSVIRRYQELSSHIYGKVPTTEKRSAYKYCRR